jgi:hypothetical protein
MWRQQLQQQSAWLVWPGQQHPLRLLLLQVQARHHKQ